MGKTIIARNLETIKIRGLENADFVEINIRPLYIEDSIKARFSKQLPIVRDI